MRKHAEFGEFLADVMTAERDSSDLTGARARLEQRAAGMSEAVPADGGFLVQPQFADQVILKVYQESVAARRCTEWTITKSSIKIPAVDEVSRADGSRWGGARGYWVNEGDALTASKPKFKLLELTGKKVAALVYLTSELMNDIGALGQFVMSALAKELAFKIDNAVFVGDGAGKPQGALNSPAKITVAKGAAASGTIITQNVVDMLARFWVGSRDGSGDDGDDRVAWFVHSDAVSQLATLVITGAGTTYLLNTDTMRMLGFPVIAVEHCLPVGTEGDIILSDFGEYHLAWRERGRADVSMHVRFLNDEQVFRFVAIVDGQGAWNSPVTPLNGSNTQSPFITLQTR